MLFVTAALILMLVGALLMATSIPVVNRWGSHLLGSSLGRVGAKTMGKLLVLLLGAVVWLLLRLFIGSRHWYNNTIAAFEQLPAAAQKKVSTKAIYFFLGSLFVFIAGILIKVNA